MFFILIPLFATQGEYIEEWDRPLTFFRCQNPRALALTFDDGPFPETSGILDVLDRAGIKATFFLVGQQARSFPDLVKQILARGHDLGNHSLTHPDLTKRSIRIVRREVLETNEIIKEITGVCPRLFRPPFGEINARVYEQVGNQLGFSVILWNIDTKDWDREDPFVAFDTFLQPEQSNGYIALQHDKSTSLNALDRIIRLAVERGFTFETVSQCTGMANQVYFQDGEPGCPQSSSFSLDSS